jgi:hypothetical protein
VSSNDTIEHLKGSVLVRLPETAKTAIVEMFLPPNLKPPKDQDPEFRPLAAFTPAAGGVLGQENHLCEHSPLTDLLKNDNCGS